MNEEAFKIFARGYYTDFLYYQLVKKRKVYIELKYFPYWLGMSNNNIIH